MINEIVHCQGSYPIVDIVEDLPVQGNHIFLDN